MPTRKKIEFLENESMKETGLVMRDRNPALFTFFLCLIMVVGTTIAIGIFRFIISLFWQEQRVREIFVNYKTNEYFSILLLLATFFVSLTTYFFVKFYQKRNAKSLGLTGENKVKSYFVGLGIGTILLSVAFFLANIFGGYEVTLNAGNVRVGVFIAFVLGWIFQGFEEELITRAAIMNYFSARSGVGIGIFANSLIFAILHLGNTSFSPLAFVNLFLAGLVFSMIFYITDSLYTSAACHSVWNFLQANIFGINVSGIINSTNTIFKAKPVGFRLISGGAFGIEGSILVSGVLVIALGVLYEIAKKKKFIVKI